VKRFKFWVIVQLLAVFASGAVVGALAYRYYDLKQQPPETAIKKGGPASFRQRYIQTMRERLKLDEDQVRRLGDIMDATRKRVDEVRSRAELEVRKLMAPDMEAIQKQQREAIEAILNEEQRKEYAKMLEERRLEMEKRKREREKRGGNPALPPKP
jgi:Spy/CpxP family protein refolding chaperone